MNPKTAKDFDHAYRMPLTAWGDVRIPDELRALAKTGEPTSSLELGCGIGRFTAFMASEGLRATGVDFSAVAIAKARGRDTSADRSPEFLVGDVTALDAIAGPFDVSFDVGCFHCLDRVDQQKYVGEVHRLLRAGGTHLIWSLDSAPSEEVITPETMRQIFGPRFLLKDSRASRRRLISSHWYWLERLPSS